MTQNVQYLRSQLDREIGTLALRPVMRIAPDISIRDAARHFREANVSSALVEGESREIITERDLVCDLAEGIDPDNSIQDVICHLPVWMTTTSYVADAARMMITHGVRHLIVLDPNGQAAGIVSMRDIFSQLLFTD